MLIIRVKFQQKIYREAVSRERDINILLLAMFDQFCSCCTRHGRCHLRIAPGCGKEYVYEVVKVGERGELAPPDHDQAPPKFSHVFLIDLTLNFDKSN